jgi:hypothetical protein
MIYDKNLGKKDKIPKKKDINTPAPKIQKKKNELAGLSFREQSQKLSPKGSGAHVQKKKDEYVDKTFNFLDKDKDTSVSRDEMKEGFASIAGEDKIITKGELAKFLKKQMGLWGPIASIAAGKIIAALDEDKNGEITVAQVLALAEEVYAELDRDKDNKVSRTEFDRVIDVLEAWMEKHNR